MVDLGKKEHVGGSEFIVYIPQDILEILMWCDKSGGDFLMVD